MNPNPSNQRVNRLDYARPQPTLPDTSRRDVPGSVLAFHIISLLLSISMYLPMLFGFGVIFVAPFLLLIQLVSCVATIACAGDWTADSDRTAIFLLSAVTPFLSAGAFLLLMHSL